MIREIVQGDNGINIPVTVPYNLTGSTVMVSVNDGKRIFPKTVTVTDAVNGEGYFILNDGDLVEKGYYWYQVTVITGSKRESQRAIMLNVLPKIGDINAPGDDGAPSGDVDGGTFEDTPTNTMIDGGEF